MRLENPKQFRSWPGSIPVHNLYTAGVAGERFLRAIQKEGKLLASSCKKCRADYLPPKIFCPFCLAELTEWKEVAPRGQVETFTVTNGTIFAFIRLASKGGLIHKLGGISPDKVRIGLKVQAVFKPAPDRKGSILDIECFRPV